MLYRNLVLILVVLMIALVPVSGTYAVDLSFAWDANTEGDLDGYRLYYRWGDYGYDYSFPAWDGIETTCTIYGLDDNTTYFFVARAYNIYDEESEDSNEVCYIPQPVNFYLWE
jgi:hypothetical protein